MDKVKTKQQHARHSAQPLGRRMTDFETLALAVCKRPGMYVGCGSYAAVSAFLEGFDRARDGGPLAGLHPWMVLRSNGGNNVAWSMLVLVEALGTLPGPDCAALSDEENARCIAKLADILATFFEERQRRSVTAIQHDYAKWLLRRKWYRGPLRP
jgi:hypothetical protein